MIRVQLSYTIEGVLHVQVGQDLFIRFLSKLILLLYFFVIRLSRILMYYLYTPVLKSLIPRTKSKIIEF